MKIHILLSAAMMTIFLTVCHAQINRGPGQQNNNTGPGTQIIKNSKKIVKQYTVAKKRDSLLLYKYIDTSKPIIVKAGARIDFRMWQFKLGAMPFMGMKVVDIKLNAKQQLSISANVTEIDGVFVARVDNNKLIPSPDNVTRFAGENYIEIYNKHHIPLLQIDLDKKTNSIAVNGVIFDDLQNRVTVIYGTSINFYSPKKPFSKMSAQEEKDYMNSLRQFVADKLPPLHDRQ